MDEDGREEEKALDDLVDNAVGSRRSPEPPPPWLTSEKTVQVTPLPVVFVLLAGIVVGGLYIYRNVSSFLSHSPGDAEVAIDPMITRALQQTQTPPSASLLAEPSPTPMPVEPPPAAEVAAPTPAQPVLIPPPAEAEPPSVEAAIPPSKTEIIPPQEEPAPSPIPTRRPVKRVDVQVGGWSSQTYYHLALEEVRRLGYRPKTEERGAAAPIYELRAGPFQEREEAEMVRRNLPEYGVPPADLSVKVQRRQDDTDLFYTIAKGSADRAAVERLAEKVRRLGLPHRVHRLDRDRPLRVVKVERLTTKDAQKLVSRLRQAGYRPKILD